jgi:predicted aldo/keto reductase-like oxidoreductase
MDRRSFLVSAAATTALAGMTTAGAQTNPAAKSTRPAVAGMQYRELGRTGEKVSAIGLGGFHIGKQQDPQESIHLIRTAIDRGITFMDNCWDYNDGLSEVRMGQALRDGYRQRVFLMTKIDGRTKSEAAKQIEQSLGRLQTDVIDLIQFHECIRLDDPDRIFSPGGALEAVEAARQAGKVRYVGFTGHKDPVVHLRMFEMAKQHGFHFDAVQMPVNVFDAHFRSFAQQVLPVAQQQGTAVLGMKAFGDHFILDAVQSNKVATPIELLRYSLSLPIATQITGIDSMPILEQALAAVKDFTPMAEDQQAALLNRTRELAADGRYELFKTTPHFDGTIKNPMWLGGEDKTKST